MSKQVYIFGVECIRLHPLEDGLVLGLEQPIYNGKQYESGYIKHDEQHMALCENLDWKDLAKIMDGFCSVDRRHIKKLQDNNIQLFKFVVYPTRLW